ncbi:MAG: hypothetical protein EP298_01515 [Gammaproteobacteria bacterium]|nr:MAG: hypothetical protein EP298_01515 [Gammaproteobacteria bacterium]
MGVATEYSFSDVPRGSKSCHLGTTTLESIRNVSLQVFLCDGGSPRLHKFIDPTCYKPIKPGYTLLVTGILKQSARHHLVDEKCYIVKSTESDVIK